MLNYLDAMFEKDQICQRITTRCNWYYKPSLREKSLAQAQKELQERNLIPEIV